MLSAEFIPSKSETGKFVSALVSTCFYVCLLVGWVGGLSSWCSFGNLRLGFLIIETLSILAMDSVVNY